MTLTLLALAGAALAGACRAGMGRAARAARAAEELQERWGALSCQATFLPRAEKVLGGVEARTNAPAPSAPFDLRLGGQGFRLVFADEQAKVDVGELYRRRGRAEAERFARAAAARDARADLRVELRPMRRAAEPDVPPGKFVGGDPKTRQTAGAGAGAATAVPGGSPDARAAFGSFGQVFVAADGGEVPPARIAAVAGRLTCWGGGKLNRRRATRQAAEALFGPGASLPAGPVAAPRAGGGAAGGPGAVAAPPATGEADVRFVDASTCHSLWIISTSRGRACYRLAVRDEAAGEEGKTLCFSW